MNVFMNVMFIMYLITTGIFKLKLKLSILMRDKLFFHE